MLPTMKIGDHDITRLIAGSNPFTGKSHLTPDADADMKGYFTREQAFSMLRRCEEAGINAVQSRGSMPIMELIGDYRASGGNLHWLATSGKSLATFDDELDAMGAKVDRLIVEDNSGILLVLYYAGMLMLSKGIWPGTTWLQRDPRTAIGHTDDGIVYLLTCDGRKTFGAAGMTYKEMGHIFQTLGCVGAANLDGGGSAQMLIRHPIADVYQIRNSPADGAERPVVNGWAVLVDEP